VFFVCDVIAFDKFPRSWRAAARMVEDMFNVENINAKARGLSNCRSGF
jgi:hypothetical protein